jgi:hypothetical protein
MFEVDHETPRLIKLADAKWLSTSDPQQEIIVTFPEPRLFDLEH